MPVLVSHVQLSLHRYALVSAAWTAARTIAHPPEVELGLQPILRWSTADYATGLDERLS